ncbi:MAG: hypothetical protein LBU90_00255 [Bacteroidales bacterium]|nr:hypothetical protein [Bacteroidales bacterium]
MKRAMQWIVLTCLLSWAAAGVAILLGIRDVQKISYMIFGAFYMLLTALCALLLQKIHKEKPFGNLRISFRLNRWFLIVQATVGVKTISANEKNHCRLLQSARSKTCERARTRNVSCEIC